MVDKSFYNTTLCQTFSPCGNYLAAGNTYGEIAIFNIPNILNPPNGVPTLTPLFKLKTSHGESVQSLACTDQFLIVGTVGKVFAWDWSTIGVDMQPKLAWTIYINTESDCYLKPDVNSMIVSTNEDTNSNLLYIGCGDNNIHVYSLEDGKLVRSMKGHENYIHSIHQNGWQLVSAGEDGEVRLWDLRQKVLTGKILPHMNPKIERPAIGKWVGDAALSDDWLICGGGPRLSLWHLRTMDVMNTYDTVEDGGLHVTRFYEDKIMAAGNMPHLYYLSIKGDVCAQVKVSPVTVYSVVTQTSPHKLICIAGSSHHIDVCTNYAYRDQVISFK